MSSEAAFLEAVVQNPDDDAPRLMYADWLTERGDPRGEFIRLQCLLAAMPWEDDRRWALLAREQRLVAEHGKGWAGPLRRLVKRWHFRRGFVEAVTLRAEDFFRHAKELFRLAPIQTVRLLAAEQAMMDLARFPYLERLRGLDLRYNRIGLAQIEPLLRSPHLEHLRCLNLRGTLLCNNPGVQRLARSEHLANLTELDLSQHPQPDPQQRRRHLRRQAQVWVAQGYSHAAAFQQEFAAAMELPAAPPLGASGLRALVESPNLCQIRRLGLAGHGLRGEEEDEAVIQPLVDSTFLSRLYALDLSHSRLGDDWLGAILCQSDLELRELNLAWTKIGEFCYREERGWTPLKLPRLRWLDVTGNRCLTFQGTGNSFFDELLKLESLICLRFVGCRSDNQTVEALSASGLPSLKALWLDGNGTHVWVPDEDEHDYIDQEGRPVRRSPWYNDAIARYKEATIDDHALEVLSTGPLMHNLRVLSFQGHGYTHTRPDNSWIGDAGVKALAASPLASGLVLLDLGNQRVTDEGLRALAESPHLASLMTLGLWRNQIADAGAEALAGSPLPSLTSVDLRSNELSSAACKSLRQRFGAGVRYGTGPYPGRQQEE